MSTYHDLEAQQGTSTTQVAAQRTSASIPKARPLSVSELPITSPPTPLNRSPARPTYNSIRYSTRRHAPATPQPEMNALLSPRNLNTTSKEPQTITYYISPSGGNVVFLDSNPVDMPHYIVESRFLHWTREQMILLIVRIGIHIRDEDGMAKIDLLDFCDSLFLRKEMPAKPTTLSQDELSIADRGILKLQNIWIYKKFREGHKNMKQQDLEAMNSNMHNGIDFSEEIFDLNDESMMYSASSKYARQSKRVAARKSLKGQRMEMAAKLVTLLDTPWTPPDWVSASRSLDFVHPRRGGKGGSTFETLNTTTGRHCTLGGFGEQCDLWSEGQVSEFSIYGPGVTNYFKFLKWSFWVMFILSVLTLPLLIINVYGKSPGNQGLSDLAATSVGNLENIVYNNTIALQLPLCNTDLYGSSCYLDRDTVGTLYMSIDIIIAATVLVAFLWLKTFENLEEINLNKNTVYTSLFTIAVKNIPENTRSIDIVSHFELVLRNQYQVVDVDFAYDNEREITKCKERGDLIKSKAHLVNLHRYQCTMIRNDDGLEFQQTEDLISKLRDKFYKQCQAIDKKLRGYDTILRELETKCDVTKVAYITFNDCVGAHLAIALFKPSFFDCFFHNPIHYFGGRRLDVRQAPEPSTIIWENLNTPMRSRIFRRVITTLLAAALILVSLGLAFSARILQNNYTQQPQECPAQFYSLNKQQQQTDASSNPSLLHCYCDQYTSYEQNKDPLCRSYLEREIASETLIYFASIIVLCVNTLIECVMGYFSRFEKHHSEDTKEHSLFLRLFILKYLNTSCVFLISSDQHLLVSGASVSTPDLNLAWYQSIGITVLLVQIGNILFVHAPTIFSYYWHRYKLRRVKRNPHLALTQSTLNACHVGQPLQLSYRYSQVISIFFACLTFSTGLPLLNFIACVNFFVFYFLEKYFFVNFYKAPYRFSSSIGKIATMCIPVAVSIHLAMSIWTLSNQNIFSSTPQSSTQVADKSSDALGGSLIIQKCRYPQTYPLFVAFCLVVGCIILHYVFKEIKLAWIRFLTWLGGHDRDFGEKRKAKIRAKLGLGARVNGGFLRAVQRNLLKDLASYSILKNPVYKDKFAISWNFASKHRRVSQVRLSISGLSDLRKDAAADELRRDETADIEEDHMRILKNEDDIVQAELMRRNRESFESFSERELRLSNHSSPANSKGPSRSNSPTHSRPQSTRESSSSPPKSPSRISTRSDNLNSSTTAAPSRASGRFAAASNNSNAGDNTLELIDLPSVRNMYAGSGRTSGAVESEVVADRIASELGRGKDNPNSGRVSSARMPRSELSRGSGNSPTRRASYQAGDRSQANNSPTKRASLQAGKNNLNIRPQSYYDPLSDSTAVYTPPSPSKSPNRRSSRVVWQDEVDKLPV